MNFKIKKKCFLQALKISSINKTKLWILQGIVIVCILSYLFYNSLLAAFIISPYIFFYVNKRRRKDILVKEQLIKNEFKDILAAVSFSLNVGYSIENAFREAVSETKLLHGDNSFIVQAFSDILRKVDNSANIEDELIEFADRTGIEDIKYFAQVFKYAKRSGGDLIAIIKNISNTVREKIEVESETQTIISGKKMEQKVMSMMPFGMILYLRMTSPDFISPLYGNVLGIIVMSMCLIVYMAAAYVSRRIVDINV